MNFKHVSKAVVALSLLAGVTAQAEPLILCQGILKITSIPTGQFGVASASIGLGTPDKSGKITLLDDDGPVQGQRQDDGTITIRGKGNYDINVTPYARSDSQDPKMNYMHIIKRGYMKSTDGNLIETMQEEGDMSCLTTSTEAIQQALEAATAKNKTDGSSPSAPLK